MDTGSSRVWFGVKQIFLVWQRGSTGFSEVFRDTSKDRERVSKSLLSHSELAGLHPNL